MGFLEKKKLSSGLKWHSKSLCMCSMWRHGEHNGEDDLCSNTAVNEWASVIRADEGTWRHLALTQQDWRFKVKHANIKNNNFFSDVVLIENSSFSVVMVLWGVYFVL